jgi:hypothetical protein
MEGRMSTSIVFKMIPCDQCIIKLLCRPEKPEDQCLDYIRWREEWVECWKRTKSLVNYERMREWRINE